MEIEIKVPAIGESVTEVRLAKWLVDDGAYVEIDQQICEIESDKATFELNAEKSGKLIHVAKEGDDLKIGDLVCRIDTSAAPAEKKKEEIQKPEPQKEVEQTISNQITKPEEKESYTEGYPSPAAAKIAREKIVDFTKIKGTGKGGRITKQDADQILAKVLGEGLSKKQPDTSQQLTAPKFSRNERKEKMSKLRLTIAKHLVAAKNQTAMLTTFNEVDMTNILEIRKKYKDKFTEKFGINLGFMSFFAAACCKALLEFPAVNGTIEGEEIIYHDFCDISIAVSTPRGLVVPVVRNAESLSFAEVEKKVIDLATRGRDNKLTLEEMDGGTFTITNGGVFGSLMSTPIINVPQSAILGMHKIEERPIALNGQVVIRSMMYVALSYDHRIIDGKESVTFLVRVKELLENPSKLIFGKVSVEQMLGL